MVRPTQRPASPADALSLRDTVRAFLAACRRPAVVEPGESPFALAPDAHSLECRAGRLLLEAWEEQRNLVRRLTRVIEARGARLTLAVERFGGKEGRLALVDLDRPESAPALLRGRREELRERFRHWLERQFCGWEIAELTVGPDLEHSLSPAYPRAMLRLGAERIAAICAPPAEAGADGALTAGLIWLDYLMRREPPGSVRTLAVFLPSGYETNTLLRLRWLDPSRVKVLVFRYEDDGFEQLADGGDTGNVLERLHRWATPPPVAASEAERWALQLGQLPDVESVDLGRGMRSYRVRGLEFARLANGTLRVGVDHKQPAQSLDECGQLARAIAAVRRPDPPDRRHAWYLRNPEAWIESAVRRELSVLDATLEPDLIYGQVCSVAGRDRGLVDLLARDINGRVAVIELKATENPNLPIQALDYWIRIRAHVLNGSLAASGYFPGRMLSPEPPRLLLVAPSMHFHSTTETILGFFSPLIEVVRIGLGVEWQRRLKVVLRVYGARRPDHF